MKNLLYLVFFISTYGHGQPKVVGLGPFKIGQSTVKVVDSLLVERDTKLLSPTNDGDLLLDKFRPNAVIQLIPDTVQTSENQFERIYPIRASLNAQVKAYLITKYEIAGVLIDELYLMFYQDKLIEIWFESNSELSSSFKLKYGIGKLKVEEKTVTCSYNVSGRRVNYKAKTIQRMWLNSPISASDYYRSYFDQDCDMHITHFITISNPEISNQIAFKDMSDLSLLKKRALEKRKQKLKDL